MNAYLFSRKQEETWDFRRSLPFKAIDVVIGDLEQSLKDMNLLKSENQFSLFFRVSRTSSFRSLQDDIGIWAVFLIINGLSQTWKFITLLQSPLLLVPHTGLYITIYNMLSSLGLISSPPQLWEAGTNHYCFGVKYLASRGQWFVQGHLIPHWQTPITPWSYDSGTDVIFEAVHWPQIFPVFLSRSMVLKVLSTCTWGFLSLL